MISESVDSIRVLSRLKTFGPTKQSFEIKNGSQKEVTVYLERLGSKHFRIPDPYQKFTVKPGASARAQVEFRAPEKGFIMTLSATYKAVIKVWTVEQKEGGKKELIDIFDVTGTGPGFVPVESLHCFDPTGLPEQHYTGRRTT